MKNNTSQPAILGGPKTRLRPFAPHPVIGAEERREVLKVLKTGQLSGFIAKPGEAFLGGPQVKRLETMFGERFGAAHAIAMNSATSALHAALWALGVEPGDEVIVTPYTMSASAAAILMCGGLPVFADIEERTYGLDPAAIESKITPRTKAIVVVHLWGHSARMKEIMGIARKYKLKVLEDCAQSPAAEYHGKLVGVLGDAGVYSLNQHKTITTGEGGVAVTRDPKLALRMQLVRNHGEVVAPQMPEAKGLCVLGWNYRMTELEASVGIGQMNKLDRLTDHRRELAQELTRLLVGREGLVLPLEEKACKHVYFVYPIRYQAAITRLPRRLFIQALAAEGIPFGEGYVRPIYLDSIYQNKRIFDKSRYPFDRMTGKNIKNYRPGSCPITERLYADELVMTGLCRYPLLRRDMSDIANAIHKVLDAADAICRKAG